MKIIRRKAGSRPVPKLPPPIMSEVEFARLGTGDISYIRKMSAKEARKRFPRIRNLPRAGMLYSLYGADGMPIFVTDSHAAVVMHATGDDLEIAGLH